MFSAGWFELHVSQARCFFIAKDSSHGFALRDLVSGIFRILEHSPIEQLGMNRLFHYRMESEKAYKRLCDRVMPTAPWQGLLDGPELASVSISGRVAHAPLASKYTVRIEPSTRVQPLGIYVDVNEHYERRPEDGALMLLDRLDESWKDSQDRAKQLADTLVRTEVDS